jgi:hypothetical protein
MPQLTRSLASAVLLSLAFVSLTACITTGSGPAGSLRGTITEAEIAESGMLNAYDVVRRLRPRWLEVRGGRSLTMGTSVLAYYDNSRFGDVEALRQISVSEIHSIEYLDGAQASAQLPGIGSEHVAGAIVVRSRPDR